MNFAHLHLLLNHFPVIGMFVGLGLYLLSFVGNKNGDLRRASLIVFAAIALIAIPTFLTGYGAQAQMQNLPGFSQAMMTRHLGAAQLSIWFVLLTGGLALTGLWQVYRLGQMAKWNVAAILIVACLSVGLMARTGNTGGEIHHSEVLATPQAPTADTGINAFVHAFEPTPEKFAKAMVASKWWWAFLMDLHFIGLALIIGTVGILDLRIMGFLKQLPIGPLHRFMPWAMAGLALNIVTGLLAYIGESTIYIYDAPFWIKMLALMLLGVNVAAFYTTGIFDKVEPLESGQDAPNSAKLVAVTSLFLWAAMIALGRYIQVLADSIPHGGQ